LSTAGGSAAAAGRTNQNGGVKEQSTLSTSIKTRKSMSMEGLEELDAEH